MEWVLLTALLAMFLWQRYGGMLTRRVSDFKIISTDKEKAIGYCSFVWRGCVYENGYFSLDEYHDNKVFLVRGYEAAVGYWLLEPLK